MDLMRSALGHHTGENAGRALTPPAISLNSLFPNLQPRAVFQVHCDLQHFGLLCCHGFIRSCGSLSFQDHISRTSLMGKDRYDRSSPWEEPVGVSPDWTGSMHLVVSCHLGWRVPLPGQHPGKAGIGGGPASCTGGLTEEMPHRDTDMRAAGAEPRVGAGRQAARHVMWAVAFG